MDIDIDLKPNFKVKDIFDVTEASMVEKDILKKHLVGVYFQHIPKDDITGFSAIPYTQAEEMGYQKIDFLSLNVLEHFDSKKEIRTLTKKEPNWELLKNKNVVSKLFHLSKYYDLIQKIQPTSISDIADVLALIRPNKRFLIDKYIKNKKNVAVEKELYNKRDPSDLRRSHALSYALIIVLQLHLIEFGKIDVE